MDKFAQVNSQSQDHSGKRRDIGEDLGICNCIAYRHETISSDGRKRNYKQQLEDVLVMKGCRNIDHIANKVKVSGRPSFRHNFATLYRNCATCIGLRAHWNITPSNPEGGRGAACSNIGTVSIAQVQNLIRPSCILPRGCAQLRLTRQIA